jgi:hypothetical protein
MYGRGRLASGRGHGAFSSGTVFGASSQSSHKEVGAELELEHVGKGKEAEKEKEDGKWGHQGESEDEEIWTYTLPNAIDAPDYSTISVPRKQRERV